MTTTFKLTAAARKAINAAARECYPGARKVELGQRYTCDENGPLFATVNGLDWAEDADLFDFAPLTAAIEEQPDMPGCAVLDCYVYDRTDLLGNLYVTIRNGEVVDAHDRDRDANARAQAILGRTYGNR